MVGFCDVCGNDVNTWDGVLTLHYFPGAPGHLCIGSGRIIKEGYPLQGRTLRILNVIGSKFPKFGRRCFDVKT